MNETAPITGYAIGAVALRWLRAGAFDPEGGFAWPKGDGKPGSWVRGSWSAIGGIAGYQWGGLPYEIDQELWVLELDEVVSAQPFPIPRDLGEPEGLLGYGELKLVARRGRLLRRLSSWTPRTAREFGWECAAEARDLVLGALREAEQVLDTIQRSDWAMASIQPADRSEVADRPRLRAELAFYRAEALTRIWRESCARAAGGEVHAAAAFASAAAQCRAGLARGHARSHLHPSSRFVRDAAVHGYLDERRRQARLLQERLGLDETIREAAPAA